jgi:iron complex transport system substrate-binding protein
MKKKLALLCSVLLLATAAVGCQGKPASGITDFLGNPVEMQAYPKRIISLTPTNTEIVYTLGIEDRLVGVDTYSDYPEAAKSIAKVGDFNSPNVEQILALKPDLVLGGNKLQRDAIEKIKALGVNIVATEATDYAGVFKSIELVGELTGAQQQASVVIADMKAKEKTVLDAVAASPKRSAYYALSFGDMGNWSGGPGSFPYELIRMAGGATITDSAPVAWVNLTQEQLVSSDPDVILLDSSMGSDPAAFCNAESYRDLKAVKNGQVFMVTSNLSARPGPRIVYGLREFAQYITGTVIKFPGE